MCITVYVYRNWVNGFAEFLGITDTVFSPRKCGMLQYIYCFLMKYSTENQLCQKHLPKPYCNMQSLFHAFFWHSGRRQNFEYLDSRFPFLTILCWSWYGLFEIGRGQKRHLFSCLTCTDDHSVSSNTGLQACREVETGIYRSWPACYRVNCSYCDPSALWPLSLWSSGAYPFPVSIGLFPH